MCVFNISVLTIHIHINQKVSKFYIYIIVCLYTKQIELKNLFKTAEPNWSNLSLVLPIYHTAATGFLFLSSLFSKQGHTNKEVSSLVDSHAYNPLV